MTGDRAAFSRSQTVTSSKASCSCFTNKGSERLGFALY
ncbi:hypothetical protein BMQ_pBM60106 (plasmid) [Priestia megaterium QM B1551]|uniref:Uncharacterized protein n=1 Tax=Priestia megaterium (strain ATCC 12872 / QMB1551) TaxID=545693 RepID=D5E412_PRIM1|nr:hypothetical protein BMQ_pBM60106 [Priestia megaterium QM B1551]